MKPSYKERKPLINPAKGNHDGRLIAVIDLGTQEFTYMNQVKKAKKVKLIWELFDETHIFDEAVGPQPFIISNDYTNSLDDRANLRKMLESWKGEPLTEEQIAGFDLFNLLGACATVNVVYTNGKGEKASEVYANIGLKGQSIMAARKGVKAPKPHNPIVGFEISGKCFFNDLKNAITTDECLDQMDQYKLFKRTIDVMSKSPEFQDYLKGTVATEPEEEPDSDTPRKPF